MVSVAYCALKKEKVLVSLAIALQTYARICWILQQQPTYLTQLSQYMRSEARAGSRDRKRKREDAFGVGN